MYALTDYIDCEALADTCEENLAEVEDIMNAKEMMMVWLLQRIKQYRNLLTCLLPRLLICYTNLILNSFIITVKIFIA